MLKRNRNQKCEETPEGSFPQLTGGEFRFIRRQAGIALSKIPRRDDNGYFAKSTVTAWERQLFVKPWQVVLLYGLVSGLTSPDLIKSVRDSWPNSNEYRIWLDGLSEEDKKIYNSFLRIQNGKKAV